MRVRRHSYVWLLLVATTAHAQAGWIKAYQERSSRYTADQPLWAGPIFTTSPLLRQLVREDFARQGTAAGDVWNLGGAKGVEIVPLPRLQFVATAPPYIRYPGGNGNGIGDISTAIKVKLAASPVHRGNYAVSALLTATVPTGSMKTGAAAPVLTPGLLGGKGRGRFAAMGQVGYSLPIANHAALGHVFTANTTLQWHALRYLWPEVSSNTTRWFGSPRDGQVQSFLSPGILVGRLPYKANERDRQRGITVGVGFQTAVTRVHTYNHALVFTTRFHF